jgi:hypothetical protein
MYDISKKCVNIVVIVVVLSLVIYFNKRNKEHIMYQLNNNNNKNNKSNFSNTESFENEIVLSEETPFIKEDEILEPKNETASNSLFSIKTVEDAVNNGVSKDPKNLTQMNCKYFNLLDDKLNIDLVPKPGELFII